MNEITITSGEQTIQFSNRAITIDGTEHPYSGITQFWRLPEHDSYAFQCDGEMVALPYEEKDGPLMTALITRITQTLDIPIEDHYSPGGGEGDEGEGEDDAEAVGPVANEGADLFSDKRFVIELVAGIFLIILGIVGFILWK